MLWESQRWQLQGRLPGEWTLSLTNKVSDDSEGDKAHKEAAPVLLTVTDAAGQALTDAWWSVNYKRPMVIFWLGCSQADVAGKIQELKSLVPPEQHERLKKKVEKARQEINQH